MRRIGPDGIAALHDTVFNHRIIADINIVQNDGILDNTVVASKWANVVAGAGSVKSSAGT